MLINCIKHKTTSRFLVRSNQSMDPKISHKPSFGG
jgi:hypothetical protein